GRNRQISGGRVGPVAMPHRPTAFGYHQNRVENAEFRVGGGWASPSSSPLSEPTTPAQRSNRPSPYAPTDSNAPARPNPIPSGTSANPSPHTSTFSPRREPLQALFKQVSGKWLLHVSPLVCLSCALILPCVGGASRIGSHRPAAARQTPIRSIQP